MSEDPRLNPDLEQLGPAVVREVINKYLINVEQQVTAIRQSIADCDPPALNVAAHTLKGSSSTLGALRLAEICRRLEVAGRDGSVDGLGSLVDDLSRESRRVKDAFRDHLDRLPE